MSTINGLVEESGKGKDIKEILTKYLAFYPLFIISLAICLGVGYYYIRITPPLYKATATILVKGNSSEGASSNADLIESALSGKPQINLSNEILQLTSDNLMQRVVAKYGFNISYFIKGRVLTSDIYHSSPFRLVVKSIKDSLTPMQITINELSADGGKITYGSEKDVHSFIFAWNKAFNYSGSTLILVPQAIGFNNNNNIKYIVQWKPVAQAADELLSTFNASPLDAKTNAIQLSIISENIGRCKEVLDAICNEFKMVDMEERNLLSENTVAFIDERLNVISNELKGVEGNLERYQGSQSIIDIKSQSTLSFDNSNSISNSIKELNIQQGIVTMIMAYFNNTANNSGKLVPSSLGLNDPTLASLIAQYNELQLKLDRESVLVGPNNPTILDMNNQLVNLKKSIIESLGSISNSLKLQERQLQEHNTQYRQFLSSLPHNERVMQGIKRKQSITEGLYLYLLQKREESAISSTSTIIAHYKQINKAKGFGPIKPNKSTIYISFVMLGLLIPIGIVYLRDLLNDKVSSQDDVTRRLPIPFLGNISHVSGKVNLLTSYKRRDLLGEEFRMIRTNLAFLYKQIDKKVILVTSTLGNEGKSFISINIASVLAMPGKKVALLEFDFRRPTISKSLNIASKKGITDYLFGGIHNFSELYQASHKEIPSLHIYSSGPVPADPGDVLLSENLNKLFTELKKRYDYVIIDSAPSGLVSDAFLLGEYSDVVLYVIRQRFTSKKQLDFIYDLYYTKKLINVGLILNDVKVGGKYGYYNSNFANKKGYNNATPNGKKVFYWGWRKNTIEN
ncbi:GumC family protein [Flavisolibacter tropicus]|uniref:non-specific protein-tyrosine kinase n=1 Tax=Flavisolibacter tropicus TaxID=1492898 RepID=A0A172TQJ0_9BACT|nr:tyrosine-protein kinase family protein [Flavisolibacter tropicus]ANE49246.1 hypothetical protein SY85_00735 [Flavisolibacter tropicus]